MRANVSQGSSKSTLKQHFQHPCDINEEKNVTAVITNKRAMNIPSPYHPQHPTLAILTPFLSPTHHLSSSPPPCHPEPLTCHHERSEGSFSRSCHKKNPPKMFRSAQHDRRGEGSTEQGQRRRNRTMTVKALQNRAKEVQQDRGKKNPSEPR